MIKTVVKEPANHTFFPFFYLLPSSWELKSLPSWDYSGMSRNPRWSAISRRCRKLPGKNNEEDFRICSWSLDDDFWSKRKDPGNYCSLLDCLGWETHPTVCSPQWMGKFNSVKINWLGTKRVLLECEAVGSQGLCHTFLERRHNDQTLAEVESQPRFFAFAHFSLPGRNSIWGPNHLTEW